MEKAPTAGLSTAESQAALFMHTVRINLETTGSRYKAGEIALHILKREAGFMPLIKMSWTKHTAFPSR